MKSVSVGRHLLAIAEHVCDVHSPIEVLMSSVQKPVFFRDWLYIALIAYLVYTVSPDCLVGLSWLEKQTTTTVVLWLFTHLCRGWPVTLYSSLLHLPLSFTSSLFNSYSLMSLSTTWFHVVLGLPSPLLPSTSNDIIFFTQSSPSFRSTCPNHLNLFCFMASDTDSIPILSLSSALSTLSLSNTPHIHLTILISILSNLPLCSAIMAHVSLPHTIILLTHVIYTFPFSLNDTSLSRFLITP